MNQNKPLTLIRPSQTVEDVFQGFCAYREALFLLVWRDFTIRYRNVVVGVLWSLCRPLMAMGIFTVIFSKVIRLSSGGIPYYLVVFCGVIPWMFFVNSVTVGAASIVDNARIARKVCLPRIIYPVICLFIHFADMLISFAILFVFLVAFHPIPAATVFFLPLFVLHLLGLVVGLNLFLAFLSVRFRDIKYLTSFLVQLGYFVAPIGFLSSIVPVHLRGFFYLNPMAGIIDAFRWSILGHEIVMFWPGYGMSLGISIGVLALGVLFSVQYEPEAMDIL